MEKSFEDLNSSYSPSVSNHGSMSKVRKPKKMAIFSKLNSIVSQSLNLQNLYKHSHLNPQRNYHNSQFNQNKTIHTLKQKNFQLVQDESKPNQFVVPRIASVSMPIDPKKSTDQIVMSNRNHHASNHSIGES
jgi:hypothetical protein